MRGARLHDALAKRRDDEAFRLEKMRAVDKYFDSWPKITTRYDHWTSPAYYDNTDKKLRHTEEKRIQAKDLEERRAKMKKLINAENKQYADEIAELHKPKKVRQVSVSTLKSINETFKRTEEEKRRLELESHLYKRWRNSPRADSILSSSKTNNEALAKMNWLDKQIAGQMEKEKLEQQRESDRLRLMEEFRKDDEVLSARKAERDQELTKLKAFQSQQIEELRGRETEAERLHRNENELRESNKQLRMELTKLDVHVSEHKERIQVSHNLRRIKMQLRDLSETILRDLFYCNELLDRLISYEHINKEQIHRVRNKFDEQIEAEVQLQQQIECMYESEAKSFALHQQDIWLRECKTRETILRDLIDNQMQHLKNEIDFVVRRQKELLEIRDCHRRAIDNSNDRIENLLGASTADENQRLHSAQSLRHAITPISNASTERSKDLVEEICLPDLFSKSANVVDSTPVSSAGRSQFGRKRVAWT